jgi:hypothetical protein
MSFQRVALRFVQPRDHDQFVTDFHSQQCIGEARFDLEARVGRAFRSLPRRVFTALDCRSDKANRLERIRDFILGMAFIDLLTSCTYPRTNPLFPNPQPSTL